MTCKSKDKTFKEKFEELLMIDDYVYSLHSTYEDPISNKIGKVDRKEIVTRSNEVGKRLAKKVALESSKADIKELIDLNNIEVVIKKEIEHTEFVYFGTYDSGGPITLFVGNIKKIKKILNDEKIDWISIEKVNQIILAHELFHYYEDVYPDLYTNVKEIDLWNFGPYTRQSKLICPGEIAAMAFTKELLGLDYNPEAINYLLYSSVNKEKGEMFFNNILSI